MSTEDVAMRLVELCQGTEWKKAAEGTTVGYKRLLQFNSVTADKVRLRILSARLNPYLSELGLFFQRNP